MYKAIKELEKREKAKTPQMDYDIELSGKCPSCEVETTFIYVGHPNLEQFPAKLIESWGGLEAALEKLILYECTNTKCKSASSLALLKTSKKTS